MKTKSINKEGKPTFIIEVKSTKSHTWQGVLTWVEEQKKVPFRSALELLRLMDSTIKTEDE